MVGAMIDRSPPHPQFPSKLPLSMKPLHLDIPKEQRPFLPENVLIYYDGPQLFWLPVPDRYFLAVALPDSAGPWPFLVAELTEDRATLLKSRGITLDTAYKEANALWLMADYGADSLILEPVLYIATDWLPGDVLLPN